MKTCLVFLAVIVGACNSAIEKAPVADTSPIPAPVFPITVAYANWKMGDPENTLRVIEMYKAWNNMDAAAVAGYFGDSVLLDLPAGRRFTIPNRKIHEVFNDFRQTFYSLSNNIVMAYSLQNEDSGENWVVVMTYNIWRYKNGKADSTVFLDHWRLTDGKITQLNSFEQSPSSKLLRELDRVK